MTGLLFCYHIGMKYYVYILRCTDGTLYTGFSTDPEKRLKTHNTGKGAKYTRGRGPLTLRYLEKCEDHSHALKREFAIKQLSKMQKVELCNTVANMKRSVSK